MSHKRKTKLLGLLTIVLVVMLSTTFPTPIAAQETEYVLRTMIEPRYEPPPAGHLNAFAPKCILGGAPGMSWISGFVVEPLAKYWILNSTYDPWLAESWEATSDGFLVHLRRGVTWADGSSFTARDVVNTFYCLYLTRNIIWDSITSVQALDDYTVLFETDIPENPVVRYYALTSVILPYSEYGEFSDSAIIAHETEDDTMRNDVLVTLQEHKPDELIATGAFEIEAIAHSDIILRKREDYWGLELGFTKGIYFDKISLFNSPGDLQVAQLQLVDGLDFDYCGGSIIGQMAAASETLNCTYAAYSSTSSSATFFNLNRYPLSLKEFRQAIAYAANVSKATLSVYPVYAGTPEDKHTSFIPSTMTSYLTEETFQSLKSYKCDPEKAEEILLDLEFERGSDGVWVSPNGTRCEFEVIIHSGWGSGKVNTYMAQQLTEFGIKANVRAIDPGTVADYIFSGDFDISSQYCGGMFPYFQVAVWAYNFLPSTIGAPGPGFPTTYEWEGEVVDVTELLAELNVVGEERAGEIVNILAKIFNDYMPFLPHYVRPGGPFFINFEHVEWPIPYHQGEYTFPTPVIKGEDCEEWTYPFDRSPIWVVIKGLAKPKELIIEPEPEPTVAAFATVEIPGFVGADGKNYGPYGKGDSMVIPKSDAERLISEGKASYTSPIVSEISEMMESIASIEESMGDLTSSISTLTDQVSALSSQQLPLTTVAVVEGIVIILLAIGLLVRRRS